MWEMKREKLVTPVLTSSLRIEASQEKLRELSSNFRNRTVYY